MHTIVGIKSLLVIYLSFISCKRPREEDNLYAHETDDYGSPSHEYSEEDTMNKLSYMKYLNQVYDNITAVEHLRHMFDQIEEHGYKSLNDSTSSFIMESMPADVRSWLDEAKRQEVRKVKRLLKGTRSNLRDVLKKSKYGYLDWKGKSRDEFSARDLRKLLMKASKDLDDIDRRRRAAFEVYEHHKHQKFLESIRYLKPEERTKIIEERKNEMKKIADSTKFDMPVGSKKQLEKVWQNTDKLEPNNFDPKTFFKLHDVDGNGFLDVHEATALFEKEIDDAFNGTTGIDHVERNEEANRMREEFMHFYDKDKDNLVSLDEFLKGYKKAESLNNYPYEGTMPHHAKDYAKEEIPIQYPYFDVGMPPNQHYQYQANPPQYGGYMDPNHHPPQIPVPNQNQPMVPHHQPVYNQQSTPPQQLGGNYLPQGAMYQTTPQYQQPIQYQHVNSMAQQPIQPNLQATSTGPVYQAAPPVPAANMPNQPQAQPIYNNQPITPPRNPNQPPQPAQQLASEPTSTASPVPK